MKRRIARGIAQLACSGLPVLLFLCALAGAQTKPLNPALVAAKWKASWIASPSADRKSVV